MLTGTLNLILPVAASGLELAFDDPAYKAIEEQLDFSQDIIEASLSGGGQIGTWLSSPDSSTLEHGEAIRAHGSTLRELHSLLKAKDPASGFGGLIRVRNKRQEFLWVHERFEGEY